MLSNILDVICPVTGYDRTTSDRNVALEYINRASFDLYNSLDADALDREVVLVVPQDTQVSLPPFIGELHAMREYNWAGTFPLNEIGAPRFTSDTWKYKWRNWTLKGKSALAQSISNASLITVTAPAIETVPINVTITGKTVTSQRITETLLMDAVSKTTVNSFSEIESIVCLTLNRIYNITVTDIANNTLAVLYNNEQKTAYIVVDVSLYGWLNQTGDGITSLCEVLYKTKYYKFYNDTDEFAAEGYDDAIAYKALALYYQGQDGKEQDAILYERLAQNVASSNLWSHEKGSSLKIQHAPNKVYRFHQRLRSLWCWRGNGNIR